MENEIFRDLEHADFQNKPKNIEDLSNEILSMIFSKLSIVDRSRCERVNHRWREISRDLAWRTTKILDLDPMKWGKKPKAKNLNVKKINFQELEFVLKRCGKYIEIINLVPNTGKVEESIFFNICPFETLASHCSNNLKKIEVKYEFKHSGLLSLTGICTNLTNLSLVYLQHEKDNACCLDNQLGELLEANKNLKHLEIFTAFQNISGWFLLKLPFKNIKTLVF